MSNQVERICPQCRASHPVDARYCGTCGATLEWLVPATQRQWLPVQLRQHLHHPVVRGVAVGAIALVVEMSVALIRRLIVQRLSAGDVPSIVSSNRARTAPPSQTTPTQTVVRARRRFWQKVDKHGNVHIDEHIEWRRYEQ